MVANVSTIWWFRPSSAPCSGPMSRMLMRPAPSTLLPSRRLTDRSALDRVDAPLPRHTFEDVLALIDEAELGTGHALLDGARREEGAGTSERRGARADVRGHPADLLAA